MTCLVADDLFLQYDAAIAVGATQVANRILGEYDAHCDRCPDCLRRWRLGMEAAS